MLRTIDSPLRTRATPAYAFRSVVRRRARPTEAGAVARAIACVLVAIFLYVMGTALFGSSDGMQDETFGTGVRSATRFV